MNICRRLRLNAMSLVLVVMVCEGLLLCSVTAASDLSNSTHNNSFQLQGSIEESSTDQRLYVTGNVVFPIANKYAGEPGVTQVIETLQWTVAVNSLPVEVLGDVYCEVQEDQIVYVKGVSKCKGVYGTVTIKEPVIAFANWGRPVRVTAEDLVIHRMGR